MRKVELLAPAGNYESFITAIEYGADAVYAGAKNFSARQSADNFDPYELEKAIDYAHIRNAKVYVAMNTIISDIELDTALEDAVSYFNMGADGIIVQDLGFASALSASVPEIPIHASTQMTIYDRAGVRKCEEVGFKRVVLARELSIDDIQKVCNSSKIEIEVFIHGALCISYSGQCLFSSLVGGRSGNRGKCAQPCRLPYELVERDRTGINYYNGKGYYLSPKDLCTLSILPGLISSGVSSLKIEGRLKTPQYVGLVVDTYRRYIDRILNNDCIEDYVVKDEDMKMLTQVFNRGGFTTGYVEGGAGPGRDMMSYDSPKNVGLFLGKVEGYDITNKRVKLKLSENVSIGDGIEIINGREIYASTIVSWISKKGAPVKEALSGEFAELGDIKGKITRGMLAYKTSDKALNASVISPVSRGRFIKKVVLDCEVDIFKEKEIIIRLQNDDGDKFSYRRGETAEESAKCPVSSEKVEKQLRKTGDTPFEFKNIVVNTDGMSYVSASAINSARRSALDGFANLLAKKHKKTASVFTTYDIPTIADSFEGYNDLPDHPGFSLYFYNASGAGAYKDTGVKRAYIRITEFLKDDIIKEVDELRSSGIKVFIAIPATSGANSERIIKSAAMRGLEAHADGVLISNPGHIEHVKKYLSEKVIICDYTFNVFNSQTAEFLNSQGIRNITFSPELNLMLLNSIKDLKNVYGEIIAYGRIPLMNSRYCAIGCLAGGFSKDKKCSSACSHGNYFLKDRIGAKFPVISDKTDCSSTILNSKVLYIPGEVKILRDAGIKTFRINVYDETPDEIAEIVKVYNNELGMGQDGSYSEGGSRYGILLDKLKGRGITKGHMYRGV